MMKNYQYHDIPVFYMAGLYPETPKIHILLIISVVNIESIKSNLLQYK